MRQPLRHHIGDQCSLLPVSFGPQLSGSVTTLRTPPTNSNNAGFVMGSPFPFLSLASSPPPAPTVRVKRNPTSNVGSVTSPSPAACHSSFLSGEPFPFLRVNQVIPALQVKIYPTLGRWLAAHGGRSGFCRWLRDPNPEFFDRELQGLAQQALTFTDSPPDVRARKRHRPPQGGAQSHVKGTRCQVRNARRRQHRAQARSTEQKKHKKRACFRKSAGYRLKRKDHLVVGTWNTRGLGAPKGIDPEGKTKALFELIHDRKWSVALLTDVRFPDDGCCEALVHGSNWLLVHEGKVGVAFNPHLAERWRAGGSVMVRAKGWYDGIRAFGLVIPADGWRPGLLLVPVYAPLLHYCEQENMVVAGSYTKQQHKATWYHNRWGTAHTLDHFLVRAFDRRWVN